MNRIWIDKEKTIKATIENVNSENQTLKLERNNLTLANASKIIRINELEAISQMTTTFVKEAYCREILSILKLLIFSKDEGVIQLLKDNSLASTAELLKDHIPDILSNLNSEIHMDNETELKYNFDINTVLEVAFTRSNIDHPELKNLIRAFIPTDGTTLLTNLKNINEKYSLRNY